MEHNTRMSMGGVLFVVDVEVRVSEKYFASPQRVFLTPV